MPNNASARRDKDKKNKDKKKKDDQRTDTLSLPKEDTAGMDSGTLSLSSAGQDKAIALPLAGKDVVLDLSDPRYLEKAIAARDLEKATAARNLEKALAIWHKEKAKPKAGNSPSLSSKEQEEQQLSLALVRMEKVMQEHAAGEATSLNEPDWKNAEWAGARTALLAEHSNSLTLDERTILRHKLREGIQRSNQLLSKAELNSHFKVAMLRTALDWRINSRQDGNDSSVNNRDATVARPILDQLRMEQTIHESPLILYERALTRPDLLMSLASMEDNIQKYMEGEEDVRTEHMKDCLLYEYSLTRTSGERTALHRTNTDRIRAINPKISREDLNILRPVVTLYGAMEWRRAVLQGEKAFLLAERKKEEELLVRGPAQTALLNEFTLSLDENERAEIYAEVRDANPMAGANELGSLLRAAKVQKALAWRGKRNQGRKDASLSSSGTARLTEPLSLEAQPKTGKSTTGKCYLSLTKEERIPVKEATKRANPNADDRAFNLAYKVALCKADGLKSGVNPGQSWEDVDFSPISDTYSEDSGQETSDDELKLEGGEFVRQRNGRPSSPQENDFLASFMKPSVLPNPDTQAKLAVDEDSLSCLFSPTGRNHHSKRGATQKGR